MPFFGDFYEKLFTTCQNFNYFVGTHPQFCEECKALDNQKNEKMAAAEQWRQYQLQNINNMFEAERQQAEEECRVY